MDELVVSLNEVNIALRVLESTSTVVSADKELRGAARTVVQNYLSRALARTAPRAEAEK